MRDKKSNVSLPNFYGGQWPLTVKWEIVIICDFYAAHEKMRRFRNEDFRGESQKNPMSRW